VAFEKSSKKLKNQLLEKGSGNYPEPFYCFRAGIYKYFF